MVDFSIVIHGGFQVDELRFFALIASQSKILEDLPIHLFGLIVFSASLGNIEVEGSRKFLVAYRSCM